MNIMKYKGYTARVEFDDQDGILIGRVIGARDSISFHADNVAGLRHEFRTSVNDYLDYCSEKGISPDKPASGKLMLRISPEIHAAAFNAARMSGASLNQWAERAIEAAIRRAGN